MSDAQIKVSNPKSHPISPEQVIACESAGCLTDTKGNKISGFDSIDKKPVKFVNLESEREKKL